MQDFYSTLEQYNVSIENKLATMVEFITDEILRQISSYITTNHSYKMLVTGGGAHNTFLISCLRHKLTTLGVDLESQKRKL